MPPMLKMFVPAVPAFKIVFPISTVAVRAINDAATVPISHILADGTVGNR